MAGNHYEFTETLWLYAGKAAWHFVTVPHDISADIRFLTADHKRGWGAVSVTATIGRSMWQTSIFPDKKSECYLLPIKAEIRKAESLQAQGDVHVSLDIAGGILL